LSWQINYEADSPIHKDFNAPIYEIAQEAITEIKNHRTVRDTGKLYRVPRDDTRLKPGKYVNPFQLEAYRRIRGKFGVGSMVSYADIRALFPDMKQFQLSYWLQYLWLHGYFEKFVKGTYGTYFRGPKVPKIKNRGKYFGVHYQVLDKK
jgi:hypothetical protein